VSEQISNVSRFLFLPIAHSSLKFSQCKILNMFLCITPQIKFSCPLQGSVNHPHAAQTKSLIDDL
jgi:hypothetical protein